MKRLIPRGGVRTAMFIIGSLAIALAITLVLGSLGGIWTLLGGPQATTGDATGADGTGSNGAGSAGSDGADGSAVQIRIRSPEAAPGLKNDSAGPLFVEENMAPGSTSTKCVSVTNVGVQIGEVRMFGSVEDHGLARHISFSVDAAEGAMGQGGVGGRCEAFKGSEIYRGTLSDLAGRHNDFKTGVRTPVLLYPNESLGFRLTQTLEASSPQGVKARARFTWEAHGAGAPSPLRDGRDPLSYQARPAQPGAEAAIERSVPEIALDVTVAIARRGWTWVLLLALAIAFLVVQDRVDRRDPRLALAKVHPEPDLFFDDVEESGYHRSEANG
jgi:hypothetical protein